MKELEILDAKGTFRFKNPDSYHNLYFPIASELGIKSVVTPTGNGDSKLNQNTFILEPTSIENLHNNKSARNFWCLVDGEQPWSVFGSSAEAEAAIYSADKDSVEVEGDFMVQKMSRLSKRLGLKAEIVSFVPYDKNLELMQVTLTNQSQETRKLTPLAAIPIYGRSADNLRDHRHVTSLLHRTTVTKEGVWVKPTLSFDERGHQKNSITYYVCGLSGAGDCPVCFYPTVDHFLGEAGTYLTPEAVFDREEAAKKACKPGDTFDGLESVGAMEFATISLEPGGSVSYTIMLGATDNQVEIVDNIAAFSNKQAVDEAKEATKAYWEEKVNVSMKTGNKEVDAYLRWICFQPFLRRVYGCSFLPHHDYGKGGRGWRDLWQDCLALLIMDPVDVHDMILANFGGVRMDGTNATIIGSKQGEFIADRNNITRVWMDHGMWPFLTTKLYMEQTGDLQVLLEENSYFKDPQIKRGRAKDTKWFAYDGNQQMDSKRQIYKGSLLEHLLLQHICASLETGEHGHILLRGADWNDAIDMAGNKGESVAFTCAYAGNLMDLADYIAKLAKEEGITKLSLLKEFVKLLKAMDKGTDNQKAFEAYQEAVAHEVSGKQEKVSCDWLAALLRRQATTMMDHIRKEEWIGDDKGNHWFNSYYDDNGRPVEGMHDLDVRMMLTGQVFAIMSGVAKDEQVEAITKAADTYLYEKEVGGYKLNTNFKEEKYDMGRMFGFAYGEKENGAVFSHMTVMYATALYQRGFIREGYKALQTLLEASMDVEKSQIYPGVPEYFNAKGKGMYHYLTGAASWYELAMVTEVFGVKGKAGDLCLAPKLVAEQFDERGKAEIELVFAGKKLRVIYHNEQKLDAKDYAVSRAYVDGNMKVEAKDGQVIIPKKLLQDLDKQTHDIEVVLA